MKTVTNEHVFTYEPKISWSTINFKTENGSRLITEYYAFTIRVDQVNFLREKFGVSANSQDQLIAE